MIAQKEIKVGDVITAKFLNDLLKNIRMINPIAGTGVQLKQSNNGTIINASLSPKRKKGKDGDINISSEAVLGRIYSAQNGNYTIDLFENGVGCEKTRTVNGYCLNLSAGEQINANEWVMVYPIQMALVEIGEKLPVVP